MPLPGFGQRGQFEVVRGKQRVGAIAVRQVPRAGLGQREAIVGRGAAADLVHQHQRLRGGVVEDVAGLAHLDHEGRLAAREVVAGADAGQDAVDRADHRARRRHEAADVREQHDQRVLAHVGRLAAHVRAGDHQHAAVVVQHQVVGFERLAAHRLDHRMAAAFDAAGRVRRATPAATSPAPARVRRSAASTSSSASAAAQCFSGSSFSLSASSSCS